MHKIYGSICESKSSFDWSTFPPAAVILDRLWPKGPLALIKFSLPIHRAVVHLKEKGLCQTVKFYFAHKRSFSPENFAQKCRKLSQIIMDLIRWSGFSSVDDPDLVNKFIIINSSS